MTEKINSTFSHKNSKSSNQKEKKNLISHPLIFDKDNIDKLEETLKTMETLEESIELKINNGVSPSKEHKGKLNQ